MMHIQTRERERERMRENLPINRKICLLLMHAFGFIIEIQNWSKHYNEQENLYIFLSCILIAWCIALISGWIAMKLKYLCKYTGRPQLELIKCVNTKYKLMQNWPKNFEFWKHSLQNWGFGSWGFDSACDWYFVIS